MRWAMGGAEAAGRDLLVAVFDIRDLSKMIKPKNGTPNLYTINTIPCSMHPVWAVRNGIE